MNGPTFAGNYRLVRHGVPITNPSEAYGITSALQDALKYERPQSSQQSAPKPTWYRKVDSQGKTEEIRILTGDTLERLQKGGTQMLNTILNEPADGDIDAGNILQPLLRKLLHR